MITQLFRTESLDDKSRLLGEIILVRPLSFTFFAFGGLFFTLAIIIFIAVTDYTSKVSIRGQLQPEAGLIVVEASQTGVVVSRQVAEGQSVAAKDILYTLSSDRESSQRDSTQLAISNEVRQRKTALVEEFGQTLLMQRIEKAALEEKVTGLGMEEKKLRQQITSQENRRRLAEDALARYRGLVSENFVSKQIIAQKESELLDQELRLEELQRSLVNLKRQCDAARSDLVNIIPKHKLTLSSLRRSINSVEQELLESEAKREVKVLAPTAGIATAVTANVGQALQTGRPLLSIVPKDSKLQAILYAQSKDVGFVKRGDKVQLRYDAFDYSRFGRASGVVASVSQTAQSSTESDSLLPKSTTGNEPLYRIVVQLDQQYMLPYGSRYELQSGMLLTGDISQETRKIYQWILGPLYSISGGI